MTRTLGGWMVALGLLAGFGPAGASGQEVDIDAVPPVVVKTVPEAGSREVDPSTTEIKVTFSKEMTDGNWSWATASKESFPETTDKPKYDDARKTCTLPVKLKPGKTYAVWVNAPKFQNFTDKDKRPAVPYLLVFRTRG